MEHSSSSQPVAVQSNGDALKLLVQGFTQSERKMLDAIVQLSQRRQPQLSLISIADAESADIVMVDAADTQANNWARTQSWLQHKSVIWIDGREAPGRTVVPRPVQWSTLPMMLARVMEQAPAHKPGKSTAAPKSSSVLVVDDSIAVRSQLRGLLESRGLAVTEVDGAEAAIKAAADDCYACILMDVLMPGIDGYEACRRIKAHTTTGKKSAVIMLTSRTSPFDRIKGKMAGCDAYLTKPVDSENLYEVVSRYIAKPAEGGFAPQRMAASLSSR